MTLGCEVLIVGSGFSGLGAAIRLDKAGMRDWLLLEQAGEVGGTWRDNDYPGLTVDMPFFIYSFPFEKKADWSRIYPPRAEIQDYALHCADKYGLRDRMRFGRTVRETRWDPEGRCWVTRVDGPDGPEEIRSRYFVSASGLLVEPRLPEIEGIDSFAGKLLHSARWDWQHDLTGERVAVIGTGATAVQLVPAIAPCALQLHVFQRTPIWLMGKPDLEVSPAWQRAFRRVPLLQDAVRWAINVLVELSMGTGFVRYRLFPWLFRWIEKSLADSVRSQIDDPALAEKLIPAYSFFCKRPSFSNLYYPTFNRENVELVTEPIERITAKGIVTGDGRERAVDTLVCATGYSVFERGCSPNFEVIGRDGLNLGDFWQANRFQAYEGATVPGFPNFFLMMGPYSAAGASYFTMIDTQSRHLVRCLRAARRRGAEVVEVKQSAHDRDFRKVLRRRKDMVLFAGDCSRSRSYYFDEHGDAPGLRPVTGLEHWMNSAFFSMDDYLFD